MFWCVRIVCKFIPKLRVLEAHDRDQDRDEDIRLKTLEIHMQFVSLYFNMFSYISTVKYVYKACVRNKASQL